MQLLSLDGVECKPDVIVRGDFASQLLSGDLVRIAKMKELEYVESTGVLRMDPISKAKAMSGRPTISVRRVDVDKGDDFNPDFRRRVVAMDIRGAHEPAMFCLRPLPSRRCALFSALR